jgi:Mrp family chromosome partitioning ATPase
MCEAAVGRRVLLVGGNMRRPGLARIFGVPMGQAGLGEVLAGQDPASVVIEVAPNLSLMTSGAPSSRVFDRINTSRTDEVLAWAREHFDLIVIDSPPSVVAGEALALANRVDAAMVVACAWKDQRGLVMKLCSQLLDSRCQLLGLVLNRVHMTPGGYMRKNAEAMAEYAERTAAFGGTDDRPEPVKRRFRKKSPKAT